MKNKYSRTMFFEKIAISVAVGVLGLIGIDRLVNSFSRSDNNVENNLRQFFIQNGYSTGIIPIPELDIEVPLKENQFYRIENNLSDATKRLNELSVHYHGKELDYHPKNDPAGLSGIVSAEYSGHKVLGYLQLVEAQKDYRFGIACSAHENGHFLWNIGKTEIIYQKFNIPDTIKSNIRDSEDFASLCGFLALKKVLNPALNLTWDMCKN